jgi:hypothetical protein
MEHHVWIDLVVKRSNLGEPTFGVCSSSIDGIKASFRNWLGVQEW